ncbi:transcriptional regulator family: Fungal Specific TF [Paecilomyces variotii]|nr:transcriptional regulator family: Fungal Specific TF [Paecilomyces variotii]KAJ9352585.1 transcriptional regulator family: Fungal Specific TF [Paecilomyces variotii]KAJ9382145.1 transcriptional regulator family: Fungal Specific TF [Paecilomyces variotii]KAJ9404912.1 transcriptional regulator family: Fungal Specific TF [Paecilomyces variotii]
MDNRGGKRRQTIRPQPQRPNAPGQRGTEPESAAIPAPSEQKVPIPRLQRPAQRQLSVTTERQRVSHACEPCRRRKAKCDGLRPVCSRCRDKELACFYADGKREKLKRNTRTLTARVALYENLLTDLMPSLDPAGQQAIRNALAENRSAIDDDIGVSGEGTASGEEINEDEFSVSAGAGSPRFQDRVQQDAAGFSRSFGFLGKSSVVRWLEDTAMKVTIPFVEPSFRALSTTHRAVIDAMNNAPSPEDFNRLLLEGCNYFLSYLDLREFGAFGEKVDAFELPPRETADGLVDIYFSTVHSFFPILSKSCFMRQYESYWQTLHPPENSILWIATLNLVFAVGALYASLTKYVGGGGEVDHVLYFIRSRILSQEPTAMLDLPTMAHMQHTTLCGMYFLASYQINRAWNIIGLAVRYAQTRALHLVNTTSMTDEEHEFEIRAWHALCSIERLLCVLTGRPPAIHERFVSTRYPRATQPFYPQETTTGLNLPPSLADADGPAVTAFTASLRLDAIVAEVISDLYSSSTVNLTWARVQGIVADLNTKLNRWQFDLPSSLKGSPAQQGISSQTSRDRMYLALRFFSTSMLINRPCLCELNEISAMMPYQTEPSRRLDAEAAMRCISSARGLLRLLPDEPNSVNLYASTPWWCILHYIAQAEVILVMEIVLKEVHLPSEMEQSISDCAKVLQYLIALSETSLAAQRAWVAFSRLLKLALASAEWDLGVLTLYLAADTSLPMTEPFQAQGFPPPRAEFLGPMDLTDTSRAM